MDHVILATEGADDQAILCSALKFMHFRSVNDDVQALDPFWQPLIPIPKKGSFHAYKNLLYPYFFLKDGFSVAIYQGKGNNLLQNLQDILWANSPYVKDISALGVVVDADNGAPLVAARRYADGLRGFFPAISDTPGNITDLSPRTGIHVWPDGQGSGRLETLLLHCAACTYPDHARGSLQFVDTLDEIHKKGWNDSTREKALIASIVSILQPGRANHASLSRLEDGWISELTLANVPGIERLLAFIHGLLDLAW